RRRRGGDFGRLVIAGLQQALAAEDLEALIVTVCRAAAGIYLRQSPAAGADRDGGRIDVAGGRDRRIGEAASRRVDTRGFVAEDPAKDVEVVDQHVLEDAAGDLDVIHRRRAGIAAGDQEHFRLADLARVKPIFERRKRGIVAALEADQAGDASFRNRLRAVASAHEREIHWFFAEDRLPRRRGALDELRVRIGRRADDHRLNTGIAEN